jgi:hypothetical protein
MSDKPADISQEAWEAARSVVADTQGCNCGFCVGTIARAIMAATERATEQAIAACERQKAIFSTNEYATPQPIGGLMERFACDQCIAEIRRNDAPVASNSNFKSIPHLGPVA